MNVHGQLGTRMRLKAAFTLLRFYLNYSKNKRLFFKIFFMFFFMFVLTVLKMEVNAYNTHEKKKKKTVKENVG